MPQYRVVTTQYLNLDDLMAGNGRVVVEDPWRWELHDAIFDLQARRGLYDQLSPIIYTRYHGENTLLAITDTGRFLVVTIKTDTTDQTDAIALCGRIDL